MDEEKISRYRSGVIEHFINCEMIINAIISQHYFGKVMKPFLLEVLYDEYFSFGLKRRILTKTIPNIDKERLADLNRLNTLRNYFAHCNQQFFQGSQKSVGFIPDPRKTEVGIDFEKLYTEFMEKEPKVIKYLTTILKEKGGIMEK